MFIRPLWGSRGEVEVIAVTSDTNTFNAAHSLETTFSDVLAGDTIVVFVQTRNAFTASFTAGHEVVYDVLVQSTSHTDPRLSTENEQRGCFKWHVDSDPGSPATWWTNFTDTSGTSGSISVALHLRGAADTTWTYGTSTSANSPSVSGALPGDLLIVGHGTSLDSSPSSVTHPTGSTDRADIYLSSPDVGLSIATIGNVSGATGAKAWGGPWEDYEVSCSVLVPAK